MTHPTWRPHLRSVRPGLPQPQHWFVLGAALAGLWLSGCMPASLATIPQPPTSYEADQVRVAHELAFAPGSTTLDPTDLERLDAFLYQVQVRPGDRVRVIGYGPLGGQRGIVVSNRLAQRGVPAGMVATRPEPEDRVSVEVTRTVHVPTACLVEANIREEVGGAVLPTLGCSNAYNLAGMVANPNDLYGGTRPGLAEGVGPSRAVDRYRSTPSGNTVSTTPLIPLITTGANQ